MDGVIYHGNKLLPGVKEFVDWLYATDKNFLFLTNSSERSPIELKENWRDWDWILMKAIFIPAPWPLPNSLRINPRAVRPMSLVNRAW